MFTPLHGKKIYIFCVFYNQESRLPISCTIAIYYLHSCSRASCTRQCIRKIFLNSLNSHCTVWVYSIYINVYACFGEWFGTVCLCMGVCFEWVHEQRQYLLDTYSYLFISETEIKLQCRNTASLIWLSFFFNDLFKACMLPLQSISERELKV